MQAQTSNLSPETAADAAPDTEVESIDDFNDMELHQNLIRGVMAYGFERPSIIQRQAIPAFVKNDRDIIAQAQSGTGKTATFTIAMLQKLDLQCNDVQAVILAPTRELVEQIYNVAGHIGQYMDNLRMQLVLGGVPLREQTEQIRSTRPQVLIATPGRLVHLMRDGYVNPRHIKMFIVDEADEMLSDGFQDQLRALIERMPKDLQIGLYSATTTPEMNDVAQRFMRNPLMISVKTEELTLDGIQQFYIALDHDYNKINTLMDLFSDIQLNQTVIFCNSKRNVDVLCRQLELASLPCVGIHSDMTTEQRTAIMAKFRQGDARVLVSTDLLCRGIDVQQVSLVINCDFPRQKESYIHRIGRSGRFGRKGVAINFVTQSDVSQIRAIEEFYHTSIQELPVNVADVLAAVN